MPLSDEKALTRRLVIPIHPVLFAAFPVLSVFQTNQGTLPIHDLWRPLLVAIAAALAIWAVIALLVRDLNKSAIATSVLIPWVYAYSYVVNLGEYRTLCIAGYLVGIVFTVAIAVRMIRSQIALNAMSVLVTLFASYRIFAGLSILGTISAATGKPANPALTYPDIFYIILDGYGREDSLKRVMGYDNSPFTKALTKRGFYVATKSHSNYCQTEISLASSLNLDLIQNLVPDARPDTLDRQVFDHLIDDNRLMRELRAQGFETCAVTTGFPSFTFQSAQSKFTTATNYTQLESTLLQMTPFAASRSAVDSMFLERRKLLAGGIRNLKDLAGRSAKPRFIVAHILAPHPPFVYRTDGGLRPHRGPFGYWDGSDYMAFSTREDYREGYVGQLQWLNRQVLDMIDTLNSARGTKPIILLQGDHGSKLHLDQNSLKKTDVKECFSNLMAYSVPSTIKAKLYPTITPVNNFRIILKQLFGYNLDNRQDRSWYSPFGQPFSFSDVTQTITADRDLH